MHVHSFIVQRLLKSKQFVDEKFPLCGLIITLSGFLICKRVIENSLCTLRDEDWKLKTFRCLKLEK